MAILRRKARGRSAGEGTTPVEEGLEPDHTDSTDPGESAVLGTDELDEADDDPATDVEDAEDVDEDADEAEPESEEPGEDAESEEPEEPEEPEEDADPDLAIDDNPVVDRRRRGLRGSLILCLAQAAHLKQAVATALVIGAVAAVAGRSAREVGVIILAVLTGQVILGWHNDLTDRVRDARQHTPGKPVADGRLEPGTVVYAMVVAAMILVPLSITTGVRAGVLYLMSVAIGMLGNVVLRTGILSWWSWAVSFGLLPYYLSYGGWGGQYVGSPPEPAIVALAALFGIGVHFTRSVWGLVADHEEGWSYLPLRFALKFGATRLLALSTLYLVVIVVLLAVFGAKVGLSR